MIVDPVQHSAIALSFSLEVSSKKILYTVINHNGFITEIQDQTKSNHDYASLKKMYT